MRSFIFLVLLMTGGWWSVLHRVREANEAQQAAEAAYRRRDFAAAARQYARAQALGATSESLRLNLAHSYTLSGDKAAARKLYGALTHSKSATTRSIARQQLGVLAVEDENYPQATTLLRQALLDNPANFAARYNYELLRAYQGRRNTPQIPPPSSKPPQNKGDSGSEQQQSAAYEAPPQPAPGAGGGSQGSSAGELGSGPKQRMGQGSEPGSERGLDSGAAGEQSSQTGTGDEAAAAADRRVHTRQRLQSLNLSEAQARQLLDAMQAAEQQYLQQVPHRATRHPDPRKPAW